MLLIGKTHKEAYGGPPTHSTITNPSTLNLEIKTKASTQGSPEQAEDRMPRSTDQNQTFTFNTFINNIN